LVGVVADLGSVLDEVAVLDNVDHLAGLEGANRVALQALKKGKAVRTKKGVEERG
jgi:hypothetical protein